MNILCIFSQAILNGLSVEYSSDSFQGSTNKLSQQVACQEVEKITYILQIIIVQDKILLSIIEELGGKTS